MKIRNFLNLFLFLAIGILTFTSCEDDGPNTGDGPSIIFGFGSGEDITLNPGEVFTVRVTADKGDDEMNSLAVYADGNLISSDRLTINGVSAASNPILLFGADRTTLTWDIEIVAHDDSSTKEYSIEVNDQSNTRSVSLNVTTNALPPVLSYTGSGSFSAGANSTVSIKTSATKGGGDITTMAIYENDDLITDVSRLSFGVQSFDANPVTLAGTYNEGWTDVMLFIKTSSQVGEQVYTIEIADEFGSTSSQMVTINVGEPLEATIVGVLFNKSGPTGTGGLDLDEGIGTGSASMLAEIRDEGNVSQTNQDWKKQISGVNSSEVKYVIPNTNGVPEDFTFGSVEFKDQIVSLYDSGVDFTATNSDGDFVSNVVEVGDIFVVKNDDNYYLLEVTEVSETSNDNGDFYRINIKK